ncbi:MAG: hypothetical protein HC800_22960 [Phormidesmis sp. RL_2_1]|nr:hypothetical protein [Phormidesmis sp. RL_2_1]
MRQFPGLAMLMLLLANMAFGFFLHEHDSLHFIWILAIAYITLECAILSVAWRSAHQIILKGFKSDVGYTLMALGIASFAVVVVAWIQISAYFLMLWAAALLLRIRLYTQRVGNLPAFMILLIISLTGLGLSWAPPLLAALY